jgi:hypothetical protein
MGAGQVELVEKGGGGRRYEYTSGAREKKTWEGGQGEKVYINLERKGIGRGSGGGGGEGDKKNLVRDDDLNGGQDRIT